MRNYDDTYDIVKGLVDQMFKLTSVGFQLCSAIDRAVSGLHSDMVNNGLMSYNGSGFNEVGGIGHQLDEINNKLQDIYAKL